MSHRIAPVCIRVFFGISFSFWFIFQRLLPRLARHDTPWASFELLSSSLFFFIISHPRLILARLTPWASLQHEEVDLLFLCCSLKYVSALNHAGPAHALGRVRSQHVDVWLTGVFNLFSNLF